jgi:hypothetical protein
MQGGSSGSSGRQYDVSHERDVIALLKHVRHSTLDSESKDEIRDQIFTLHVDADPTLLEELSHAVAPLNIKLAGVGEPATTEPPAEPVLPPIPKATETPKPEPAPVPAVGAGFAGGRRAPQFGAAAKTIAPAPAAAPEPIPETNTTPTVTPPPPVPEPAPAAVVEVPPAPESALPPEPTPTPDPVTPEPPAAPAPNPSPEPTPTAATDPMARIKEIKHAVNAAVGNPVNLIDATNDVGREYMTALLEAMKAVQGGGDSTAAMARLEQAFAAVEASLAAAPAPVAKPESVEPTPPPVAAAPEPPAPSPAPAPEPDPIPEPPSEPTPAPTTEPEPAKPESSAIPLVDSAVLPLQSVAEKAAAVAAAAPPPEPLPAEPADPLTSEAVTDGLNQLLNEWALFKAAGLLKTGPKGADHPLYQELRNLPMSFVIAGRFEGATPEVKQSIHDYMNGWRYEQGMTHDIKETFEHYLRRVVKTIIDKQSETE